MSYRCELCEQSFEFQCQFDRHIKRKTPCVDRDYCVKLLQKIKNLEEKLRKNPNYNCIKMNKIPKNKSN